MVNLKKNFFESQQFSLLTLTENSFGCISVFSLQWDVSSQRYFFFCFFFFQLLGHKSYFLVLKVALQQQQQQYKCQLDSWAASDACLITVLQAAVLQQLYFSALFFSFSPRDTPHSGKLPCNKVSHAVSDHFGSAASQRVMLHEWIDVNRSQLQLKQSLREESEAWCLIAQCVSHVQEHEIILLRNGSTSCCCFLWKEKQQQQKKSEIPVVN